LDSNRNLLEKEGCIIKQNRIFAKQNMRFYQRASQFRLGLLTVEVLVEFDP